jgi:hypothetical protein
VLGLQVRLDDALAELLELGLRRRFVAEPLLGGLLLGPIALRADPVGPRGPLLDRDRADRFGGARRRRLVVVTAAAGEDAGGRGGDGGVDQSPPHSCSP